MSAIEKLTRRERQVMDILFEINEGSVNDVIGKLDAAPSYSAIRAVLGRLVSKGLLRYYENGPRYVYSPVIGQKKASRTALKKVIDTFFDGSPVRTVNALMGISANKLTREELDELERIITKAKEEGI